MSLTNVATQRSVLQTPKRTPTYAFVGLEPGEYVLTAHPQRIVGAAADGLHVTLDPSREIVDLAIDIDDP